jgi:hypothetical protein
MRLLASLLALTIVAGCLSSGPAPTTPASGTEALGDGPALATDLKGTLGNGYEVPLASGALLRADDTSTGNVPVDPTLHRLSVWLNATDPGIAMLRDAQGHLMCAARSGRVCSAPINVTQPEQWPLSVYSLAPRGGDFDAHVALYHGIPVPKPDGLPAGDLAVARSSLDGGEPTLAWTKDGSLLIASGSGVAKLDPQGAVFTDATPPVDAAAQQTLDPFLYGDPVTGRIYVTQLASCMRLSWTDDGGSTWTTNPLTCGGPDQHHQKVTTGPGPLGRTVHIATMNLASWLTTNDVVIFHSQSLDGGVAWTESPAMTKQTAGMEARAVGNIAVLDDGTIAIIAYLCDKFVDAAYNGVAVGRSTDRGATWTWTRIAPGGGRCEGIDPGIAAAGNALYASWEDLSAGTGHVWWSSSGDGGATWGKPRQIPTGNLGSMVFTDATASKGRLAAAFLGTADTTLGPTQAPGWAHWYPYLASLDLTHPNATWQVVRLQEDPVQVGPICMDGPLCLDGARNLLDFVDVQLDAKDRAAVAYADGCEKDCVVSWQSRGAELRVATEPAA